MKDGIEPTKHPGELSHEEKWNELKRHLMESLKCFYEMQKNPKADSFYFFLRENAVREVLEYMMFLDGKDNKDTKLLIALLGDPSAYTVPPYPTLIKENK